MIRHRPVRLAEMDAVCIEGSAKGASRIPRRGRHKDPVKARFAKQPRIGDTVQGDAATQAKVGQPGLALEIALAAMSAKRRPSQLSGSIGSYGPRGRPNSSTKRRE